MVKAAGKVIAMRSRCGACLGATFSAVYKKICSNQQSASRASHLPVRELVTMAVVAPGFGPHFASAHIIWLFSVTNWAGLKYLDECSPLS